jgi:hypothetical protein
MIFILYSDESVIDVETGIINKSIVIMLLLFNYLKK